MANKRDVDELKVQLERAELVERAQCDVQEIRAGSDDGGPSHQSREAWLDVTGPAWPKHKIFLSHSGVQKAFTEHLCKELERVHHFPFFDRRADSLRKGERFYSPLMTAARRCRVAVLVLSEEFFTASKWPMMEVNEFVKAQKLDERVRILPLYLEISREELGERDRQARWIEEWKVMATEDKRIDVEEWECALRQIAGNNGMAYGGKTEGEAAFIDRVVEAVCQLVPSDVKWDVSHVRSMEELSKPIVAKLKGSIPREEYNVQVVGLYGMGGGGKTTISRAICNEMFGDFVGKVCYIEFGEMNVEELLRIVLQELTEASPPFLKEKRRDQLLYLWRDRICRQKVLLVLDNVLDDHIDDAEMFLDVRYCDGSMVLVTSRSLDMLGALGIARDDCLEMPNLEEEGAIDLFLHYAKLCRESLKDKELEVIRGCVQECFFLKSNGRGFGIEGNCHYLPLALKVLGIQLRGIGNDVFMWERKLGELRKGKGEKFNMLKKRTHPVFSVLRLGYDAVLIEDQHIFLDLALFLPLYKTYTRYFDIGRWQWMGVLHEKSKAEIQDSVNILQRKGLLESDYDGDELNVNIHDLYKEFAEAESQGGPFEGRHSLVSMGAADGVPRELLKHPPNGLCWPSLRRLVIWRSKVRSLTGGYLRFCKNVELLDLRWCGELEVVDVTGMDNLRCVMVYQCFNLRKWIGLEKLQDLVIFRFKALHGNDPLMPSLLRNLSSLRSLQVLELWFNSCSQVVTLPPDLSACTNLQELSITGTGDMFTTASGVLFFGNHLPKSLLKFYLASSWKLTGSSPIRSMSSLTNLVELRLCSCYEMKDLTGLCELTSLQELAVTNSDIFELPSDMRALKHLQVLHVSSCLNLTSLVGISQCATTLRHVYASGCSKLRYLPDDFSCFQKLETFDLSWCGSICTLPQGYERLAGHLGNGTWILDAEGCYGLIVPLVKMLRLPVKSHVRCVDSCDFGGDSMQSWIDGWKHANSVGYELLIRVFSVGFGPLSGLWTYMLEEGEVVDFVIRALCEHDDRDANGTHRPMDEDWGVSYGNFHGRWRCWSVVVTAPCTFGVVMERAMLLEPWGKTLLHYIISSILPSYVGYLRSTDRRKSRKRSRDDWCLWMAMKTLLQKCTENLEKAIVEGILPVHSCEGKKVVDIISGAIAAADGQEIGEDSILWYQEPFFSFHRSYEDLFPNFPFEKALRRQQIDDGIGEGVSSEGDDCIGVGDDSGEEGDSGEDDEVEENGGEAWCEI